MDFPRAKALDLALRLLAGLSYVWLCLAWFDHELSLPLEDTSPLVPAALLTGALGGLLMRRRRRGISIDGKIALGLALASFVTRLPYVFQSYGLFSSDAAAQGIMELHILEGRHHPIFLYNWSYVGSAKAHLGALLAWIVSEPVVGFALAAALVYASLTFAVYLASRTVLPRPESIAAALYVVFAPGFLTAWGMGNEGNYPDVLALGTLMLVFAARLLKDEMAAASAAFWMGALGGLAFWIHILATYYLLASVLVLVFYRFSKATLGRLALFGVGFFLGDFPGILWNVGNDFLSFRWWGLDASTAEASASWLGRTLTQLRAVFETSFGVLAGFWPRENPPAPVALFRIALSLLIPLSFAVFGYQRREKVRELLRGRLTPEVTYLGFAILVVVVFAQSSFGWMTDEPRYLLFLFSVVPIFVASTLAALARRTIAGAVVVAMLLVFVSLRGSLLYYAVAHDSDTVNRTFLRNLEELGITYVRSDYHLSYKYVFLSHGRMVWTSELGPAQTEWYPPFREIVAKHDAEVALVPRSFRFARRIERRLGERKIRYRRENLLYPVLFDFSEPVRVEDVR